MKRAILFASTLVASVLVTGCSTTLSRAGSQIRTLNANDKVEACTFLGVVTATSPPFAITPGQEAEYAMNDARNKVAQLGGTHMKMLTNDQGVFTGATINAEAYRCPSSE